MAAAQGKRGTAGSSQGQKEPPFPLKCPYHHILLHSQIDSRPLYLFIYLADHHVLIETIVCRTLRSADVILVSRSLHSTTSKSVRKRQLNERSTAVWKCTFKSYGEELQDKRAYSWLFDLIMKVRVGRFPCSKDIWAKVYKMRRN